MMRGDPPNAVRPFALGERWREYYSPTYDLSILALWVAALLVVAYRIARHGLWRRERPLEGEAMTLTSSKRLGARSLDRRSFASYTRVFTVITRYAVDFYPAMAAAACLCAGMALVGAVRKRAPQHVPAAQLFLFAGVVALDIAGWRGWASRTVSPYRAKGRAIGARWHRCARRPGPRRA